MAFNKDGTWWLLVRTTTMQLHDNATVSSYSSYDYNYAE